VECIERLTNIEQIFESEGWWVKRLHVRVVVSKKEPKKKKEENKKTEKDTHPHQTRLRPSGPCFPESLIHFAICISFRPVALFMHREKRRWISALSSFFCVRFMHIYHPCQITTHSILTHTQHKITLYRRHSHRGGQDVARLSTHTQRWKSRPGRYHPPAYFEFRTSASSPSRSRGSDPPPKSRSTNTHKYTFQKCTTTHTINQSTNNNRGILLILVPRLLFTIHTHPAPTNLCIYPPSTSSNGRNSPPTHTYTHTHNHHHNTPPLPPPFSVLALII
jgi:hypothetical protein